MYSPCWTGLQIPFHEADPDVLCPDALMRQGTVPVAHSGAETTVLRSA